MIDVTIYLKCSKKPGTLSRLIRDIKLFGLIYSSHDIQHQHDFNLIAWPFQRFKCMHMLSLPVMMMPQWN